MAVRVQIHEDVQVKILVYFVDEGKCQKFCVLRSVKKMSSDGAGEALAEHNG